LDSVKFRLDSRLGKSTVNCIHKLKVCIESCGYTLQLGNKRTLCSVTKQIHTKPASRLARINAGMHVADGRWQQVAGRLATPREIPMEVPHHTFALRA